MSKKREHCLWAGSSADRADNCPGSVRIATAALAQGFDVAGLEDEALLGECVHDLVEKRARGEPWPEDGIDVEAYDLAEKCCEWFERKTGRQIGETAALVEEKMLIIDGFFGEVQAWVYPDHARGVDGCADVKDWKSGQDPEHPETVVAQLKDYVVAACQKLGKKKGRGTAYYARSDLEITVELDEAGVVEHTIHIAHRKARCHRSGAPLKVGPWCRTCPGSATCPLKLENEQKLAKVDLKEIQTWTPEKVSHYLAIGRDQLAPALASLQKRALELVEMDPGCLPDFRPVVMSRRSIDVDKAHQRLVEENAAIPESTWNRIIKKSVNVSDLEKAFAEGPRCLEKDKTKKQIKEELAEIAADAIKTKPSTSLRRVK